MVFLKPTPYCATEMKRTVLEWSLTVAAQLFDMHSASLLLPQANHGHVHKAERNSAVQTSLTVRASAPLQYNEQRLPCSRGKGQSPLSFSQQCSQLSAW